MENMLASAYRAMEPPPAIISIAREIGGGQLTEQVQQVFMDRCINDEICRKFPPSLSYVRSVLKHFILAAEAESNCVLDILYREHAAFYLPQSSEQADGTSRAYKTYTYAVPERDRYSGTITLRVSVNILEGGTGCYCWPAGVYLAEVLLSYPWLVQSKCCVELGSGAGMVGICLSRLQPSKVVLTDGDRISLANLKHNLGLNGISLDAGIDQGIYESTMIQCRQLLWESSSNEQVKAFNADIILAADVIYDPECVPYLVQVLAGLLKQHSGDDCKRSPTAFVATVKRNPGTLSMFLQSAREAGLEVLDITKSMVPMPCFQGLSSLERADIVLHKVVPM